MTNKAQDTFVSTYHVSPQLLVSFLIFIVSTLTYLDILNHQFVNYDDGLIILPRSATFDSLTFKNIKNIVMEDFPREEPLIIRDLSYLVNGSIFGAENPQGYLLGNFLLHVLTCYLVFSLSLLLFPKSYWQAILTAVLFAIHPVHVESVAWISARKDLLYSFFLLAGLLSYSQFIKTSRPWQLAATLALYLLALFSKSSAIAFVPVALLYRLLLAPKKKWGRLEVAYYLILVATSFLFLQWYSKVLTDYGVFVRQNDPSLFMEDPGLWLTLNIQVVTFYLGKLIYPATLSNIYDFPSPNTLGLNPPFLLLSLVTTTALLFALLKTWRLADKRPLFLLLWFFVVLGPYLNWAGVKIFVADRYFYLAAFAPMSAIAYALTTTIAMIKHHKAVGNLAVLLVCLVVSALIARGIKAVQVWSNSSSLWSNALITAPLQVQPYVALLKLDMGIYNQNKGTPAGDEALARAKTLAYQAYRRYCAKGNCRPQATGILFYLAKISYEENNLQMAEKFLNKGLLLDPEIISLNFMHAILAIKKEDYQGAKEDIALIKRLAHPYMDAAVIATLNEQIIPLIEQRLRAKSPR